MLLPGKQLVAMEISGVDIPDSITLQGSDATLVLNGAGLRKKLFMKIYAGALYLPEKMADEQAILSDPGPASVDMYIIYSEISKEKIIGGWEDGLKANLTQLELDSFRPRLDQFNTMFKAVQKGDTIRIAYLPDIGTEVRINDEWRGVIPGNDFYRALLKIWIGASPVNPSLKDDMLGRD